MGKRRTVPIFIYSLWREHVGPLFNDWHTKSVGSGLEHFAYVGIGAILLFDYGYKLFKNGQQCFIKRYNIPFNHIGIFFAYLNNDLEHRIWFKGEPSPERGETSKKYYKLTKSGIKAFQESDSLE